MSFVDYKELIFLCLEQHLFGFRSNSRKTIFESAALMFRMPWRFDYSQFILYEILFERIFKVLEEYQGKELEFDIPSKLIILEETIH